MNNLARQPLTSGYSQMQLWTLSMFGTEEYFTTKDGQQLTEVINTGPMGVGKTHIIVVAFGVYLLKMRELGYKDLRFAIIGRTMNAIRRNILNVMATQFGDDFVYDHSTKNGITCDARLFGFPLFTIPLNDANAESRIRGLTDITGAIIDELTLITESHYTLILSRIRGGQQLPAPFVTNWVIASTNPDAPTHWLLKNYIQKGLIKNIQWHLRDATWPGFKQYIKKIKRQYRHMPAFYERFVLGRWTAAEGLVYTCFTTQNISDEQMDAEWLQSCHRTFISIDFGSNHPTSVQSGHVDRHGKRLISTNKMFRRTALSSIIDYVIDLKLRMTNMYGRPVRIPIYYDPAAAAVKDELDKRRVRDVLPAKNEHTAGIAYINNLFDAQQLFILTNNGKNTFMSDYYKQESGAIFGDGTEELVTEIYGYKYKPAESNNEEVVKINDDACDAMRYAIYSDAKYNGDV